MVCDMADCDYSAKSKQSLKFHMDAVHLGILKFSCNACEYKSYYKHNVKKHQELTHEDEKTRVLKIGCLECMEDIEHSH